MRGAQQATLYVRLPMAKLWLARGLLHRLARRPMFDGFQSSSGFSLDNAYAHVGLVLPTGYAVQQSIHG